MEVDDTGAQRPRIVTLTRGSQLPGCDADALAGVGAEIVRAGSPYEAAAEVLAAPTAALVVDLRLLTGRHTRLIDLARRMEVEMFAVGALPADMTAEDLSGVRLMAGRDLPVALGRAADGRLAPTGVREPPVRLTPAKGRQPAETEEGEFLSAADETPAWGRDPSGLLSAEELDALLGDPP